MKKLAAVTMMLALVALTAAMASAQNSGWGAIHGTYSMTASGGCLHSSLGFDGLKPKAGSLVWGAVIAPRAIWTFASDGTGAVSGTNYILDFPPGSAALGPIARQAPISFTFQYEVTDDGTITVFPPAPPNLVGMISKDHKTLTLSNANEVQSAGGLGSAICNVTRNLIRVEE